MSNVALLRQSSSQICAGGYDVVHETHTLHRFAGPYFDIFRHSDSARGQHTKTEKTASLVLLERFILNTPPLLCGVDEIRFNLIDGGQTRGIFLVARRVRQYEDENASVGMKLASGRSLGRGERIGWGNMIPLDDQPSC